jgi:hypothetical protein
MATQFEKGFEAAIEMFDLRLQDDEVMHNIWWAIKREENFPSQDFIADIIYEFLIRPKEKVNNQHGLCCVECHANGTAQGEHTGASVERERIIKLLEEQIARLQQQIDEAHANQTLDIIFWQGDIDIIKMSIALIKGENK